MTIRGPKSYKHLDEISARLQVEPDLQEALVRVLTKARGRWNLSKQPILETGEWLYGLLLVEKLDLGSVDDRGYYTISGARVVPCVLGALSKEHEPLMLRICKELEDLQPEGL